MEYTISDEEEPYNFNPNEINYDASNQNWYQEEDYSGSDFEGEPYGDEREPEPPDRYTMSHSYAEPCTNMPQNTRTWTETNSYFCEEDDNANYHYHPPMREEKSHHYRVASYQVQTQSTPAAPKKQTKKRCDYTPNPLIFTGSSKDPEVYLRWETTMKQWLRSHNIPKEEKLNYALSMLEGDAYKWWLREDAATYYTTKPVLDWGTLKSRMYREFTKKYQPHIRTTKTLYPSTPKRVATTPKPQRTFEPKNAYCPKPKNVLTKQEDAKQSIRVKEVQQKSISTPILEPQCTPLQSKSSNSVVKILTCYRCHKRGHFAANCPNRQVINPTPLELKSVSLKACDNPVKSDFQSSNSSLLRLSLPKDVDTGPDHIMENSIVDMSQEETTCESDSQAHAITDQDKQVNDSASAQEKVHSVTFPSVFNDSMTALMHLSSVQKVKNVSGTKAIQSKYEESTPMLIRPETKKEEDETTSCQLKEEPPDGPHITKPSPYQGKALDSQNRMKANLLSLGADCTVSRSKLFKGGGYDEAIKPATSTTHHGVVMKVVEYMAKYTKDKGETNFLGEHVKDKEEMIFFDVFQLPKLNDQANTKLQQTNLVWSRAAQKLLDLDRFSLKGGSRPKHDESSDAETFSGIVTQNGSPESWNQVNIYSESEDMIFTSHVNLKSPGLDLRALIGTLRSNQEELSYKSTWYGILIHQGSHEIWKYTKQRSYEEVMNFSIQGILDMPYLEAFRFGRYQERVWHPGEYLLQLEALKKTPRCILSHWINWIQSHSSTFEDFPFQAPKAINVLILQHLFPYAYGRPRELLICSQIIARHSTFMPKLSRLKHHHNLPYLA